MGLQISFQKWWQWSDWAFVSSLGWHWKMNSHSFTLAEQLIPATYLQQAAAAKKTRESLIRQLIEQVCDAKGHNDTVYCF